MEECEYCGCIYCECNSRVDGYECKECGYTPTQKELQRGSCPQCLKNRRISDEVLPKVVKEHE